MPKYLALVLSGFLLTGLSIPGTAAPLEAYKSPPRFAAADLAYRHRRNPEEAKKALEIYRDIYTRSPEDSEAAWRLAMACHFAGMRLTTDPDEKLKLFAEGRDAGKKSLELTPDCAACHFWTAINMALYGDAAGVFKMIFTLGDVKHHLEATIAADPAFAYGGPYRLLGLISQKLPGILGGSNDDARAYFEKAIEITPDEPLNYLFLAHLYKDEMNEPEKARLVVEKGLKQPLPSWDRLESHEAYGELNDLGQLLQPPKKTVASAEHT